MRRSHARVPECGATWRHRIDPRKLELLQTGRAHHADYRRLGRELKRLPRIFRRCLDRYAELRVSRHGPLCSPCRHGGRSGRQRTGMLPGLQTLASDADAAPFSRLREPVQPRELSGPGRLWFQRVRRSASGPEPLVGIQLYQRHGSHRLFAGHQFCSAFSVRNVCSRYGANLPGRRGPALVSEKRGMVAWLSLPQDLRLFRGAPDGTTRHAGRHRETPGRAFAQRLAGHAAMRRGRGRDFPHASGGLHLRSCSRRHPFRRLRRHPRSGKTDARRSAAGYSPQSCLCSTNPRRRAQWENPSKGHVVAAERHLHNIPAKR